MDLIVAGVVVGKLYEPPQKALLVHPPKRRPMASKFAVGVPKLLVLIGRLPKEEKLIVKEWLSRRRFPSQIDKRDFLRDALEVVTRQMQCNRSCCAGMSGEERLNELRDLCR